MATATAPGKRVDNSANTPASEIVYITWYQNQYTKHAGDQKLRSYRDPKTKEMRELTDPVTGQPKPFVVFGGGKSSELSMSNPWHKTVYEFILGGTKIGGEWMGHPSFHPNKGLLKLENRTAEAKMKNLTRRELRSLEQRIEDLSKGKLMELGIYFSMSGDNVTYDDVLDGLVSIVNTPVEDSESFYNVTDIKKVLDSPDYEYKMLVAVAINKQLFKLDGSVYRYEGKTIGIDADQIVQWLKDNPQVYESMKLKHMAKDDMATDK